MTTEHKVTTSDTVCVPREKPGMVITDDAAIFNWLLKHSFPDGDDIAWGAGCDQLRPDIIRGMIIEAMNGWHNHCQFCNGSGQDERGYEGCLHCRGKGHTADLRKEDIFDYYEALSEKFAATPAPASGESDVPQAAERGQRRVVCAAILLMDGTLVVGARHWDRLMHNQCDLQKRERASVGYGKEKQGFIDQHGVFMGREEAWKVAEAAGQILYRCGGDGARLFSENLY